jgi:hypothetical protein
VIYLRDMDLAEQARFHIEAMVGIFGPTIAMRTLVRLLDEYEQATQEA